jgi:cytochrome c553
LRWLPNPGEREMNVVTRLATCLLLLTSLPLMAAGDAVAGKEKSAMCAACHGADGNSAMAIWPKLAGQHAAYIERQLGLIKSGMRPVPEMAGIAAGLSAQDMADLGAYYATLETSPAFADPALVELGERLYRAGNEKREIPACMGCHGPAGEGNPLAGYPALAGQHASYTATMLARFESGETWGEDDAASTIMAEVSDSLLNAEIEALASYIQGLYRKTE